ncbi:hypothetical protein [Cryptosporangium minutisporangium]|uniref:MinD-like ATPase involved in chromosome partitioning or flagellar assembly n=1 Tax=Cryptosporangium minutisporangium TaxID=113569 RepID=A0ABP6T1N0_9ACTN
MPLIVWASASGAPGVTSTALAVTAAWPALARLEPVTPDEGSSAPILVEADPYGGDLAARFRAGEEPGLAGLAAAARSPRGPDEMAAMTRSYARTLGGTQLVTAPVGSGQTRAALSILAAPGGPLAVAGLAATPLLIDAGRLSPASPIVPLLPSADLIVLVTRTGLAELAHTRELAANLTRLNPSRQVLLRGPNPYPAHEVAAQLGIPLLGCVPDDRRAATSPFPDRWRRRGKWVRAITAVAAQLADEISTGHPRSAALGRPSDRYRAGAAPRIGVTGGTPPAAGDTPLRDDLPEQSGVPSRGGLPAGAAWPAPAAPRWPVPAQRMPTGSRAPAAPAPTLPGASGGPDVPSSPGNEAAPPAPTRRPS